MGFRLLGTTTLRADEKKRVVAAFKKGIEDKTDTLEAGCFDPHHGLEATVNGHRYTAIICYKCLQVYGARDGQTEELKMLTTASPTAAFEQAVRSHHLPESK